MYNIISDVPGNERVITAGQKRPAQPTVLPSLPSTRRAIRQKWETLYPSRKACLFIRGSIFRRESTQSVRQTTRHLKLMEKFNLSRVVCPATIWCRRFVAGTQVYLGDNWDGWRTFYPPSLLQPLIAPPWTLVGISNSKFGCRIAIWLA